MTVREAFSKAFGEVPEGAKCRFAHTYMNDIRLMPTYTLNESVYTIYVGGWTRYNFDGEGIYLDSRWNFNPDISDRPAESFRGFFGKEYDDVLDAQEKA